MALTQKEKQIKEKKVDELSTKVAEKQAQIDKIITQHNELVVKLQQELDEIRLAQKAYEDLK